MESALKDLLNGNTTIAAPATAPGTAALAIMRVSGPAALEIADKLWKGKPLSEAESHSAHLGTVLDTDGKMLDQAVATVFRAPNSFTGEDSVEFTTHGSPFIQSRLLKALVKAGAKLAQPGEFTRRAFLNGKLDLTQAEAIADIIAADSKAAHRIAADQLNGKFAGRINQLREELINIASLLELELDFSEEDVEFASRKNLEELARQVKVEIKRLHNSFSAGDAIMHGIPVAIAGPANAGKSSLLNAILGHDRAIVSPIEGTTRDTIEETIHIGEHLFRFIDTAGLRDTNDPVEKIGIDRTHEALDKARIILYVHDATLPLPHPADIPSTPSATTILLLNKTDLLEGEKEKIHGNAAQGKASMSLPISAETHEGLDSLRETLKEIAEEMTQTTGDILIANARHAEALASALNSIDQVIDALTTALPPDLIAQSLRETIAHLSVITGSIPSATILSTIFSRFCIGK